MTNIFNYSKYEISRLTEYNCIIRRRAKIINIYFPEFGSDNLKCSHFPLYCYFLHFNTCYLENMPVVDMHFYVEALKLLLC